MFPPHVRSADAALGYLSTWCDIIGSELLDGISWDEIDDTRGRLTVVRVLPFRIGFAVGTVLTGMGCGAEAHGFGRGRQSPARAVGPTLGA
ncbi:MAG: hypothetical protein ACRD0L_09770 [Acidimicrobiales bacterium]